MVSPVISSPTRLPSRSAVRWSTTGWRWRKPISRARSSSSWTTRECSLRGRPPWRWPRSDAGSSTSSLPTRSALLCAGEILPGKPGRISAGKTWPGDRRQLLQGLLLRQLRLDGALVVDDHVDLIHLRLGGKRRGPGVVEQRDHAGDGLQRLCSIDIVRKHVEVLDMA